MSDVTETSNDDPAPDASGFPVMTVAAAFAALFVFLGLMWFTVTRAPAPSSEADSGKKFVPNLEEVQARNDAALRGVGAKMPLDKAHAELLSTLKTPNDKLPFPTPDPNDEPPKTPSPGKKP
ncbi:MAG: hypothetical protein RMJ56_13900 [Gemmataceae bacterium]|nr:hypothetical protein [Gemmata sp.]MDW8198685.1 hypothetical protein [Gemmataceae bacterium]